MSKERLEEIEKNLDPLGYGMGGHLISVNDIYWLVKYAREQAERVEELEEEVDRLNGALHYQLSQENIRNEENRKLKYKNKRYREALEFYVGGKHVAYKLDETDDDLVVDYGETARKALEESE